MGIVTVRYGAMGMLGVFNAQVPNLKISDKCVVKTDRGTELGIIISSPVERPAPAPMLSGPAQSAALGALGGLSGTAPVISGQEPVGESAVFKEPIIGEVLRKARPEDFKILENIEFEKIKQEFEFGRKKIAELNLPIDLVFVEHLFGGEKIVFYFVADGRVDFRELVKELAKEYKTRIEMRQIGVRDEARLLADVEHCGRELCCKTFIKELEPVTMKMAKSQKTTLDPAKISGRCGRLMCCLRYEDEIYMELKSKLPHKGSRLSTKKGLGDVVDLDIFGQAVVIENDKGERIKIKLDEIVEVLRESALEISDGGEEG
ncbi:MAG: regulatory iron-sulfur-containing complex subunit RicT [Planctomycetota bacterium]